MDPASDDILPPPGFDSSEPLMVDSGQGEGVIGLVAEEKGPGKVEIKITCDCPFKKGQLRIAFLTASGDPLHSRIKLSKNVSYVNKGENSSEFEATGEDLFSYWLVVRLHNSTASHCRKRLSWRPPKLRAGLKAGEYKDKNCVVWKLVEFPKQWNAKA
jgi:hypothetical protein